MIAASGNRDAALRAAGRNLANFQRLEHCLKRLAAVRPVDGTTASISRKLEKRRQRLSRSTLGKAIGEWLSHLGQDTHVTDALNDLFDVTARLAFAVDITDDEKNRHAAALSKLLAERNAFVHDGLLGINWESRSQCQELEERLDAQNERLGEELEFLSSILRTMGILADAMMEARRLETPLDELESPTQAPSPDGASESDT